MVKIRVVDHVDELKVLHDAQVDLIQLKTNKVTNLGVGLVRSTVIEESGDYAVVVRLKAHVQRSLRKSSTSTAMVEKCQNGNSQSLSYSPGVYAVYQVEDKRGLGP